MHIRRGFALAGRKAYYSARFELIKALRLVAQGLDSEYRTKQHSEALGAGLTALEEATDFIPRGSRLEADLNMQDLIGGHRTAVLKNVDCEVLTPMEAVQHYLSYSQEKLAAAVSPEFSGSMALYVLGKVHLGLAGKPQASCIRAAEPKAVTFFQAALVANGGNSMAANDLGVLLGRAGRFDQARKVLEYSLRVCPQSTTWKNLAKIYERLGRVDLAWEANYRGQMLEQVEAARATSAATRPGGRVRWVDRGAFAQPKNL